MNLPDGLLTPTGLFHYLAFACEGRDKEQGLQDLVASGRVTEAGIADLVPATLRLYRHDLPTTARRALEARRR